MSHGSYVDPRHLLGGRQLSALHAGGGGGGMKTHLDKFKVLFPMGTLICLVECPCLSPMHLLGGLHRSGVHTGLTVFSTHLLPRHM